MGDVVVTWDWGARSETLRQMHASLQAKKSFLLTTAPLPVSVGVLDTAQIAGWDAAVPTPLTTTAVAGTYTAKTSIPASAAYVRLDFKLQLTIGGTTATCLEFSQLFSVGADGALLPTQYSFADITYENRTSGPAQKISPTRRIMLGACPLLTVLATGAQINCEFIDVTELWWANWAAKDEWGWYLDSDLGGRSDLLRVLAWTSGAAPMLWFVAVSPQAAAGAPPEASRESKKRAGADIVFFRAPAGFNSFFYTSDAAGFLHPRHGNTTMLHLARWLLSPLSLSRFLAKQKKKGSDPKPMILQFMCLRLIPITPAPAIDPPDPIDMVRKSVQVAFRPASVEGALSRSPAEDIAFLPLGFDGTKGVFEQGGYAALAKGGELKKVMSSARRLLWMRSAVGRSVRATPTFERAIWLLGSSAANASMFAALKANAPDIARIISCDAAPVADNLFKPGVPALEVASARKTGLRAFFITTPHAWSSKAEYEDIKRKIANTKVDVTMLPLDVDWDNYWTYPPSATSNPLLFEVLRDWDGNGLSSSKRMGDGLARQWLFWHEWAVHGGHLIPGSATADGQGYVKTFLEDVLRD